MIVGIDLGTTHSLIGIYAPDGPRLLPNALHSTLTPSVISIDETGSILVGQAARERLTTHPQHSVANFKRWMGSSRETLLGKRHFRPEELSALILRSLVADAEAALGEKIHEAVISVPAYFSDSQRKATRAAGELTGLRVERLINEPTAAALAYGLQERSDGGRFLILDLGGGTFDVSILELFDGVVEVHASAGDNFLGGEDFLDMLISTCCHDLKIDPGKFSAQERAITRQRMEKAKRLLDTQAQAEVEIVHAGVPLNWCIDDARFATLSEPLLSLASFALVYQPTVFGHPAVLLGYGLSILAFLTAISRYSHRNAFPARFPYIIFVIIFPVLIGWKPYAYGVIFGFWFWDIWQQREHISAWLRPQK